MEILCRFNRKNLQRFFFQKLFNAKEKCQKLVKEQEFKIRKLKEKMAGIAPTKKNKARLFVAAETKSWVNGSRPWQAEIAAVKEQVEELQADGNYRAAMSYVRKLEEARVFSMLAIEIEVGYNK